MTVLNDDIQHHRHAERCRHAAHNLHYVDDGHACIIPAAGRLGSSGCATSTLSTLS